MSDPDLNAGAEALARALTLCGENQSELARRCGVKQPHVWKWLRSGRVPAERVPAVVRAVDGQVKAHELRPDLPELFPAPSFEGEPNETERRSGERREGDRRGGERREGERRSKAA
ncbi:MAG: helix-turn-helix domain-containing protein [Gammaproteobacteria bacterium]|nr:helix-turn-helix domain-containing protein [Gammaproteobacteria bacterium]MBU1803622.1 helix-turn-helix domain-containing protein [Gammaproteobacteria bacterium]